jgi:phospholipid transport system substrate-binding protein
MHGLLRHIGLLVSLNLLVAVSAHADFKRMSGWVMGKHWKRLSEGQRQQFVRQFKTLLIRTRATALHSVSAEDIRYLPERKSGAPNKSVVRTEVKARGTAVTPVHYPMHRKNGRWLVYDVRIKGVSLIANYRSTFSAGIEANGANALIAMLQQKNGQQMAVVSDNGHTAVVSRC